MKLVHEPLGSAETEAEAIAGRKVIRQCLLNVRNARSRIREDDA